MKAGSDLFYELFNEFVAWSILVFAITFIWQMHHSLRYRSKDGSDNNVDNLTPGVFPKENDDLRLELTWTILPFILIVYLTYISWGPLSEVWTEDPEAHQVGIHASQWNWGFDCGDLDEDICSISNADVEGQTKPKISLKAGESYTFILTSEDVTHAPFFVDWGIKEDSQPGMVTKMYYKPSVDEIGTHLLLCTEYCGDDHGYMTAVVEVHA
ncbi:MAG: cytochrome c oxidase subunit II [Candidatus Thermoplasmatota archaeon]|nr:cytochrome c oxidase subunit II [Candidatus Thermoplasmatota archaeon]